MKNEYWRITYEDAGIYEALKNEILKISNNPKEEWDNLKKNRNVYLVKSANCIYQRKFVLFY